MGHLPVRRTPQPGRLPGMRPPQPPATNPSSVMYCCTTLSGLSAIDATTTHDNVTLLRRNEATEPHRGRPTGAEKLDPAKPGQDPTSPRAEAEVAPAGPDPSRIRACASPDPPPRHGLAPCSHHGLDACPHRMAESPAAATPRTSVTPPPRRRISRCRHTPGGEENPAAADAHGLRPVAPSGGGRGREVGGGGRGVEARVRPTPFARATRGSYWSLLMLRMAN